MKRRVRGHSNYFVTEDGRVFRDETIFEDPINPPHELKKFTRAGSGARNFVNLLSRDEGDVVVACDMQVPVDRIVATAFCRRSSEFSTELVLHLDGDVSNDDRKNLKWVTRRDYIKCMSKFGAEIVSGDDHWRTGVEHRPESRAKMSAKKVGKNNPMHKGSYMINGSVFHSLRDAAQAAGVSPGTVRYRCMNNFPGHSFVSQAIERSGEE